MKNYKMRINGKPTDAESGKTYTVINPATEEVIANMPLGGKADVDKAVASARNAFPKWSAMAQADRSRIMFRLAMAFERHIEEFAQIDVEDHGTPISLARVWGSISMKNLEYASQAGRALTGDSLLIRPNAEFTVKREPIGVCALIVPWNSPILMITSKIGAAITSGNTCVVKPASIDSIAALKFAEVIEEADIPPGVVNVITGHGSSAGTALASHPGTDMISFTGSSETGKMIMSLASQNLTRVQMELGGKNPFIVFDDADVESAVVQAASSAFHNTGMVCAAPGRFYVHEKVHDMFVERFISEAKKVRVGDPLDEKTDMGPVVSAEHRERVEKYIKSGMEEGAALLLGGGRPADPALNKGYFIMPAVFTNVKSSMKIFKEEIFGPVACFIKFSSEEEVIQSANDNVYGLCASVWTRDVSRGYRVISRIDAGAVGINSHRFVTPDTPWGGFKESGFGKENSIHGLEEYTRLRLVTVDYS